jgi:hypothetical protein
MSTENPILCVPKRISKVLKRYPDRVPVIITGDAIDLQKRKFLVPKDAPFAALMHTIRKGETLKPWEGLYFHVNNKLVPSTCSMGDIYNREKEDGPMLQVNVSRENVFG